MSPPVSLTQKWVEARAEPLRNSNGRQLPTLSTGHQETAWKYLPKINTPTSVRLLNTTQTSLPERQRLVCLGLFSVKRHALPSRFSFPYFSFLRICNVRGQVNVRFCKPPQNRFWIC